MEKISKDIQNIKIYQRYQNTSKRYPKIAKDIKR